MRFEDWPVRLAKYIEESRNKPFQWGEHDCAIFAAGAVKAITGIDPAAEYRGQSESARESYAWVKEQDGSLLRIMDSKFPRHKVAFARRGDICMWQNSLGVCVGRAVLVCTKAGLVGVPLREADYAWGVS